MKATKTKRGKRPGLRARSKNAREGTSLKSILRKITLIERLAQEQTAELLAARAKLDRCRLIMEINDPMNARDIFGPPLDDSPAKAEGESPQAQPAAPAAPEDAQVAT